MLYLINVHNSAFPYESSSSYSCLPAILNLLGKDAIVISQPVTVGSESEGSHGVEEAGRQPPETPVSKTRIFLYVLELFNVQAQLKLSLNRYCRRRCNHVRLTICDVIVKFIKFIACSNASKHDAIPITTVIIV